MAFIVGKPRRLFFAHTTATNRVVLPTVGGESPIHVYRVCSRRGLSLLMWRCIPFRYSQVALHLLAHTRATSRVVLPTVGGESPIHVYRVCSRRGLSLLMWRCIPFHYSQVALHLLAHTRATSRVVLPTVGGESPIHVYRVFTTRFITSYVALHSLSLFASRATSSCAYESNKPRCFTNCRW
jgi:hypothetical protein